MKRKNSRTLNIVLLQDDSQECYDRAGRIEGGQTPNSDKRQIGVTIGVNLTSQYHYADFYS